MGQHAPVRPRRDGTDCGLEREQVRLAQWDSVDDDLAGLSSIGWHRRDLSWRGGSIELWGSRQAWCDGLEKNDFGKVLYG
jgi:hypothetical protein